MKEKCPWCNEGDVIKFEDTVYWELPDGSKAIEITDTPSLTCTHCDAIYLDEKVGEDIENQLFLIDRKQLSYSISYPDLMELPKILKKNYFKF